MKGSSQSGRVRIVAIGGALAFAASVIAGGYAYAVPFGQPASPGGTTRSIAIDVLLFVCFGLHHSLFARAGLKDRVRGWVGAGLQRSVYVWIASVLFFAMVWFWQPVAGTLWRASGIVGWLLMLVQLGGLVLLLAVGRRTDVLDLAGLRQTDARAEAPSTPINRGPYRLVRHPLYLAVLLLLWPAPVMTGTRFLFTALFTAYVVVAIPFEERDLRQTFGDGYAEYARRVRWRLVPGVY
jgi:protein-S-isoprenylcysteine O-methyltransferase Ste14